MYIEEGTPAPFTGGLVPAWQINEAAKAKIALDICLEEQSNSVCPEEPSSPLSSAHFISGGVGFVVGVLLFALAAK